MSATLLPTPERTDRDAIFGRDDSASLTQNAVVRVKADPDAPKLPMPGALVRLHERVSGRLDWQGYSGADGAYHASGLVPGAEYVPVGIDVARNFASVASGPVVAQRVASVVPDVITAIIGQPLEQPLRIAGASGATVARIKSGTLPSGVSYRVRDGFSGAWPTGAAGDYSIIMEVQDASGVREQSMTVRNVLLPLHVTVRAVMYAAVDEMCMIELQANGGEAPYSWSVTAGSLPDGLSLNDETGVLSGTPDAEGVYSFTVLVEDARGASATRSINIVVAEPDPYWADVVLLTGMEKGSAYVTNLRDGASVAIAGDGAIVDSTTLFGLPVFQGSGAGSRIPFTHANLAVGTGDFTLEMFAYRTGWSTYSSGEVFLVDQRGAGADQFLLDIASSASKQLRYYVGGSARITGTNLINDSWVHLAVCRKSGTTRLFVDGVVIGSWSDSSSFTNTTWMLAARYAQIDSNWLSWNGYLAQIRITKAARYDAAFTPPDTPFAAF